MSPHATQDPRSRRNVPQWHNSRSQSDATIRACLPAQWTNGDSTTTHSCYVRKYLGTCSFRENSRISVTTQIEVMFGRKGMSVKVIWCQFFKIYFIVCFHNDSHILQSNCNEILRRWDIFIDQSICISIVDLIVHENFMMFIANSLCEVFCTVIQGNIKKCE